LANISDIVSVSGRLRVSPQRKQAECQRRSGGKAAGEGGRGEINCFRMELIFFFKYLIFMKKNVSSVYLKQDASDETSPETISICRQEGMERVRRIAWNGVYQMQLVAADIVDRSFYP
jgi:hypothetical protein